MPKQIKWFLISAETVEKMVVVFTSDDFVKELQHELTMWLHKTDKVPADFQEQAE